MIDRELTDALDVALGELHSGEQLPDVLGRHAAARPALAQLLRAAAALEPLHAVEMPTPERRADDRNRFLAELTREARRPVPAGPLVRVKEWFTHLFAWQAAAGPSLRREPRRMNALMLKFVLVVTMLFGSAGGTAVAAANSLPGSPLYPAKLAIEQARLQVATDPSDQAQLHVILARLRVQEMVQLALAGRDPGQAVMQQLQQHLDAAMRTAAAMPEAAMQGALARWQQQIQQEETALQEAQLGAGEPVQEPLRQALQILQQTQQQLQVGQQNGQAFRWQHGLGLEPEDVVDAAAGDCQDCEPEGDAHRFGPQPETPAGPGTCDDCEPTGDQYRYGQDADQPQPGPGQPGGPETQPCDDCEPDGDQYQYGPGEPGGPETQPCDDCEPDGDQHQYGPDPDQPGPGEPGGAETPPCDEPEPDGDQHQHGEPIAEPDPVDDPGTGDSGGMGDSDSGGGMGDPGSGGGMGNSGSGGGMGDSGSGDTGGGGRSH